MPLRLGQTPFLTRVYIRTARGIGHHKDIIPQNSQKPRLLDVVRQTAAARSAIVNLPAELRQFYMSLLMIGFAALAFGPGSVV